MRGYKTKPKNQREEALKEIRRLFKEAQNSDNADKLVGKARRLAMKFKIRMPSELRRKFCKYCYSYLGKNVRVRKTDKALTYTCLKCGKSMRFVK